MVMVFDFMKIFLIDGLKKVFESKNVIKIKEEIDKLKVEVDKYFVFVLFLEVEWFVGKKMLEIYVGYILED